MAAEHDRLAGIEQGVREIKSDVSETKEAVAGLKVTVDLLVAGKIKQGEGGNGSCGGGQDEAEDQTGEEFFHADHSFGTIISKKWRRWYYE